MTSVSGLGEQQTRPVNLFLTSVSGLGEQQTRPVNLFQIK